MKINLENLKKKYKQEYQIYSDFYKKSFLIVFFLGILTAFVCFFLSFYFEDFITQQANNIAEHTMGVDKNEPTNIQKFFSIFFNNLFLGGLIILSGFIPIYGLPFIYALLSFASVGIITGYGSIMKHDVLQTMMIAFLPHAVIEIFPILYSVAVGIYINKNIVHKLFFRKRKTDKVRSMLVQGTTSLLMIILPLFLLAALVEAFITSHLADIYL
ncbi:stage II sporulation protein M [Niallia sp. NCCP-28]|uniref:stage II sporulation protein M n=1 Tax=Niallia sp. NCCP-28 TaxID=2934712 RepID=UPI0020813062|nr:stage II sporulation protein M [Niallia sp. NCCP-28]GKU82001.1 hypothetical protein NCCP28_13970 [Niallia sp. NCCP-28]